MSKLGPGADQRGLDSREDQAGGIDLINPECVAAGFDGFFRSNLPLAFLVGLDGPNMLIVRCRR